MGDFGGWMPEITEESEVDKSMTRSISASVSPKAVQERKNKIQKYFDRRTLQGVLAGYG